MNLNLIDFGIGVFILILYFAVLVGGVIRLFLFSFLGFLFLVLNFGGYGFILIRGVVFLIIF